MCHLIRIHSFDTHLAVLWNIVVKWSNANFTTSMVRSKVFQYFGYIWYRWLHPWRVQMTTFSKSIYEHIHEEYRLVHSVERTTSMKSKDDYIHDEYRWAHPRILMTTLMKRTDEYIHEESDEHILEEYSIIHPCLIGPDKPSMMKICWNLSSNCWSKNFTMHTKTVLRWKLKLSYIENNGLTLLT